MMETRSLRRIVTGIIALLAFSNAAGSAVLELTSANFDGILDGSSNVLVAFVAPWCGHSRSLAPAYAQVASHFAASFPDSTPHVRIARVDASLEPELARAQGIDGYPTLKWYPVPTDISSAGPPTSETLSPSTYAGVHAAANLAAEVEARAGLVVGPATSSSRSNSANLGNYRPYRAPQPAVQALSGTTFDAVVYDPARVVLVMFTAPWCTHCATLAPIYERVAQTFADDADQVAICSVDAEQERGLTVRFDVSGFPTLRLFPRDDGPAETYFLDNLDGGLYSAANQNRKKTGAEAEDNGDVGSEASADAAVAALVSYVNSKAGTSRLVGGALEPSAGRVPAADAFLHTQAAAAFFVAEEATSPNAVETAMAALRKASTDSAAISVYVAVLEKARARGAAWLQAEPARLRGVAASPSVNGAKRTQLLKRLHVTEAVAEAAALDWASIAASTSSATTADESNQLDTQSAAI